MTLASRRPSYLLTVIPFGLMSALSNSRLWESGSRPTWAWGAVLAVATCVVVFRTWQNARATTTMSQLIHETDTRSEIRS
jgi:hypothetical protein